MSYPNFLATVKPEQKEIPILISETVSISLSETTYSMPKSSIRPGSLQ